MLKQTRKLVFDKLKEQIGLYKDSEGNEEAVKSIAAAVDAAIHMDAFFDGGTVRSAYFGVEPMLSEEGSTTWTLVPVIRFEDGSSYALPEVFFNETDFADLFAALDTYETRLEAYFDEVFHREKEVASSELS